MNIKELAKEAGLKRHQEQAPGIDGAVGSWEELTRFAALVAAHEREECAKVFELITHKDATVPPVHFSLSDCARLMRARGKA